MKKKVEFFTVDEFAEVLRVHPNTIRKAIRTGRIQAFKTSGGRKASYRIYRSEIERMAAFDATEMIENIIRERNEQKLLSSQDYKRSQEKSP